MCDFYIMNIINKTKISIQWAKCPENQLFPNTVPNSLIQVIKKLIAKIQNDVDDEVIPVSTGIYSEEKLI